MSSYQEYVYREWCALSNKQYLEYIATQKKKFPKLINPDGGIDLIYLANSSERISDKYKSKKQNHLKKLQRYYNVGQHGGLMYVPSKRNA